jgi:iron complex outermembrane receptor protein
MEKTRVNLCPKALAIIAAVILFGGMLSSSAAEEYLLEETKVTATKTGETNLQTTPLTITSVSGENLKSSGANSIQDLSLFVPNTEFTHNIGYTQGFIRGIGSPFPGPTAGESNIAYYLDGVYIESGQGLNMDFLDIDRIEVLRGPQGTLYGRNANAGAINIITRKPTDQFEATGSAELGNYNKRRFDATFSGPIVDKKVKARLTFYSNKQDGLLHNTTSTGNDPRSLDESGVRGTVDIDPSERVNVRLAADYWDARTNGPSYKLTSEQGTLGALGAKVAADFWDVNTDRPGSTVATNWGTSGTINIKLPRNMVFRSITAYRNYESDLAYDCDGSQINKGFVNGGWPVNQVSEELQLNAVWNRWQWITGLFYYNQRTHAKKPTVVQLDYLIPGYESENRVDTETDSYAAFGSARYALTDRVSLEAGARYAVDRKYMAADAVSRIGGISVLELHQRLWDQWQEVLPRFAADYRPTDNAMLYASASRGYKPGGFAFPVIDPTMNKYLNPEYIWNYETGVKTEWLDKKLRINAALFFSQYKDMQVYAVVNGVGQQSNAAKATVKGIELESQARPVKGLTLNASISYLKAVYDEFISVVPGGTTPFDVSGNRLAYAPDWKITLGAQYEFKLAQYGFLTLRGDLSWKDKIYFDQYQRDEMAQKDYPIVNALMRLEPPNRQWGIEIYGKNIFAEKYYTSGLATLEPKDFAFQLGDPCQFGTRLTFRY